jgi:hypothetical protein
MTWWRRDPSLFSRSPFHRCAQRILRDDEAALRKRAFSRTPSHSSKHEHDGDKERPDGMSNLEWMQLQHYQRWRKRLHLDPYKTLFGASNDMLSGKGLKDWEWLHKSFPKWMLKEMDIDEQPREGSQGTSRYPKKVDIRGQSDSTPEARESLFPQPSFRKAAFERDVSSGIVSPSDLRRPREASHVRVVGEAASEVPGKESGAYSEPASSDKAFDSSGVRASTDYKPIESNSQKGTTFEDLDAIRDMKDTGLSYSGFEGSGKEMPSPEAAIDTKPEDSQANVTTNEGKEWRQTAIERRVRREIAETVAELATTLKTRPQPTSDTNLREKSLVASDPINMWQQALDPATKSLIASSPGNKSWFEVYSPPLDQIVDKVLHDGAAVDVPTSKRRSSSEVLKQLPRDDLDFLSAADIRASMGTRRSRLPTDEQTQKSRQNLEKAFLESQEPLNIDSMSEAVVVNNQHVRRTEREMRGAQIAQDEEKTQQSKEPATQDSVQETPVESSIERMKRWLETTGASFARQFWQDPTEEADVTKTKLFFDKVAHYVKKGQAATRQITEDLEKDIPASKALLRRLKSDEEQLDLAIHRLRQRSSSGHGQGLSPRKIRAMESLKTRFHQTNSELEKAYEALRGLVGTESVTNATGSFKRRLTTTSKMLHKNAQLLRMLIWSLQTRLEDPKIDRNILSNYKVVADNLLSLRDTQMTLMRLVDRAMLVYGVVPNVAENEDTTKTELSDYENCEDPFVRARLAADAHLISVIKAHKSPVKETVNDQPQTAPKPVTNTFLEEPTPLVHSLFRPFGPAIEKLGNKELRELAAEKAQEEEKRKLGDLKLVDEVKKAYEDTYGTITVDHRQPGSTDAEPAEPNSEQNPTFEMLKDDPALVGSESGSVIAQEKREESSKHSEVLNGTSSTTELYTERNTAVNEKESISPTVPAVEAQSSSTAEGTSVPVTGTSAESAATTEASTENLPTHYTIVVRDSQTDTLSITTSTTGPPRDPSLAVPLHQALSALDSPAKFIPYITEGLEVVSAKNDILVLRDAIDSAASTRPFETIRTTASPSTDDFDISRGSTNPIDGTTRLSPTGYVGPEESAEQLEKEFQERRQAAGKMNEKGNKRQGQPQEEGKKAKRRGGAGGVIKTAIWVAGVCYVAGVVGEIATATV